MRNPTKSFLSLAVVSALLLSSSVPALAWAQELAEAEHRALGGVLKRCLDLDAKPKDKEKAKEELLKSLEKIGKKRVEKDGDAIRAALALHVDLGRAVALANDYKNAPGGKTTTESFEIREKQKQEYGLWLPPSYRATTMMPLILVFPPVKDGKPMAPSQFLQEHWIEGEVRDKAIIAVLALPESQATWNQLDTSGAGGLGIAMFTFNELTRRFAVDRDRVYLLGRGEGVAPAVTLGSMYPQRFAAVVGTAGDAGQTAPANFQNLPTYFQGAGGDATAFEQKNKELGYDNCTINAAASVTEMWSWMHAHPRIANPAKVTLAPSAPAPNKAYWIEIQPTEGQGILITAEADRATNTISIKATSGVPSVSVFLNDALVDLSKPVKVVLNGREQTDVIPRSVDDFLALLNRGTCDAGMIYTARKTYDLPE